MTIKECIDIVDNIKPNQYTIKDKVMWLSFIDEIIINDVLKTHEGYDGRYDDFEGYSEDKLSVALIVPSPYDRLYTAYLKMKIDGENGETARYNNSASLYNTYMLEYRKYYNKTHMPLNAAGAKNTAPPKKTTVGLTEAEYENLKRDLTYILTEYFSDSVSPERISAIVIDYMQTNAEMLKGKDGYTPKKGVDYFTEAELLEIIVKAKGDNGYSPVVQVTEKENGVNITITDAYGRKSFDLTNGVDGVSPEIEVTEITDGHRVSITDVDGTKTFDVTNGVDGVSPAISVTDNGSSHIVSMTDAEGTKEFDVKDGVGIASVVQTTTSTEDDGTNILTISLTDGTKTNFKVKNGSKGGDDEKSLTIWTQEEWDNYCLTGLGDKSKVSVMCDISLKGGSNNVPKSSTVATFDFYGHAITGETSTASLAGNYNAAIKNAVCGDFMLTGFSSIEFCTMKSVGDSNNLWACEFTGAIKCTNIIGCKCNGGRLIGCKNVLLDSFDGVDIRNCTNVINMADVVAFDNTGTDLSATTIEEAIKEVAERTVSSRTLVINTQEEWDTAMANGFMGNDGSYMYVIVNCGIKISDIYSMPEYVTHLMLDFRNNVIYSETDRAKFNGSWDYDMAQRGNVIKNARFSNVDPQYFKSLENCIIENDVFSSDNLHNCEIAGTAYGCTGIIGGTANGLVSCNTVLLNSYDGVTMTDCTNVINMDAVIKKVADDLSTLDGTVQGVADDLSNLETQMLYGEYKIDNSGYSYIVNSPVGSVCDYENPTDRSVYKDMYSIVVKNVREGDVFHYYGQGLPSARSYAWLDNEGVVLSVSDTLGTLSRDITAPANASILVCNFKTSSAYELIRLCNLTNLEKKMGDIDTALDGIISIQNSLIGGDA